MPDEPPLEDVTLPPAFRRRIEVEQAGDVTIAAFVERRVLEDEQIQQIGDALFWLVDVIERRKVLIDYGSIEFLSSATLGKLITLHRKLQAAGGWLAMCRVPPDVMDVFRIIKINRIFTIVTDPARADAEVRAVFGDLLDPGAFAPDWRTDTVLALARQARESGEFGAMPILADALQDAGCTSDVLLAVCRSDAACVRRRWALEAILGR